jgi:hypothetical protein
MARRLRSQSMRKVAVAAARLSPKKLNVLTKEPLRKMHFGS